MHDDSVEVLVTAQADQLKLILSMSLVARQHAAGATMLDVLEEGRAGAGWKTSSTTCCATCWPTCPARSTTTACRELRSVHDWRDHFLPSSNGNAGLTATAGGQETKGAAGANRLTLVTWFAGLGSNQGPTD
jgi:hypothetical protein